MIDVPLASQLLSASAVIFVGDVDQLPSVGPAAPADARGVLQDAVSPARTREFELRRKGVQTCLYAWDIALLPDESVREQQIEQLWQTCKPHTHRPLPEGFAIGFRQEMRDLMALKRDLLPTAGTFLANTQLEAVDEGTDRLIVTTEARRVGRLSRAVRALARDADGAERQARDPGVGQHGR